jgi:DNA-binding response OmpR family regulator
LSATTESPKESPPRILLLEDETNLAKGLQLVIGEAGYEVDWAETGKSALELVRRQPYDLIVADLCLPDLDGLEIIKEIKQRQPQIRVIVITGYSTVASAIDAFKLGTSDYLEKPFTENEIMTAISEVLVVRSDGVSQAKS